MATRKKKRKVHKKNLTILVASVAAIIALVGAGAYWVVSSIEDHKTQQALAEENQQKLEDRKSVV